MKIAFNPSNSSKNILDLIKTNKDIIFDLKGHSIYARGVEFKGTDTNTWRDIKINNVSIGSHTLDLRNGSNTTLSHKDGIVTINSTWRPVVDNLSSDSTTSSLSAKQGKVLVGLINSKSDSGHTHDDRYLRLTGGTMFLGEGLKFHSDNNYFGTNADARIISLLDNNDKVCDGGLIIDERGTLYGKEYVTELLRIRDSEFKWKGSNILHSGNSHINGSTITLNGTSITVYNSGTADGRYVKKSGDTMSGALNLANNTWNKVGDDSYMGDCNVSGHFGIKAANTTYPGIAFFNNANAHLGSLTAYSGNIKYGAYSLQFLDNGNTSVNAGTWTNPFSAYNSNAVKDGQAICVWGQSSYLSNLANDTGNMSLWLKRGNAKIATLNMVLDGEYYANGNQRLAHVSEIPSSLRNPYALTISLNGTSQGPYDGSATKNINITPGSIGAATSGHNHDGRYVYNYGGIQMDGASVNKNALGMSTTSGITGDWWHILQAAWSNEYRWNSQIAFPTQNRNGMYYRSGLDDNTKWGSWVKLLDTGNSYVTNGKGVINGTTITQVENATNATNSTNARKLVNWYSARPTSLNAQFGDGSLRIFYATSSTTEGKSPNDATVLHLAWDNNGGWDSQLAVSTSSSRVYSRSQNGGTWQPWKTLAFTTDIPTSLKNPHSLTLKANGTTLAIYDGSSAKEANFTYANVGAASANHTHSYYAVNENYGGFKKAERLPTSGFYQSYISDKEESGGNAPWKSWMHLINCQHNNTGNNYALQIAASFFDNNIFKIRVTNNSVNNAWRDIIHSGNIGSQSVNYANSAGNSDKVDGYHATDGRTFTNAINWSDNWNDSWSDGTNKHPWYGFDHRYPNTGAYSTTITDYFGMTIKTANTLRLDFGTLLLNGIDIHNINVASASKLQTARKLWGQSFDGTADVSGSLSGVANIQFSTNNAYDIGSNSNASRYIYTHWLGSKSGANLRLAANNSDNQIVLHTNGNVGIGTNSPSYKLQVNGDIHISHSTNDNMSYNTSNPRIVFSENGVQAVGLVYTDYNNYRANKGLKVMDVDNNDTGNVWLEVQGFNYSSGYVKNGSNNNYVLLGGGSHKTESSLRVAYASSAGSATSATKVIVNQHTTNGINYPLVWSNQANTSNVTENQLYKSWADLYYNPKNKRLTVGGSVVTSSFIKSGGTSQQLLRADGGIASFNWTGQSGQPAWLWGGNSEHSYYVYNPSNFRVAYASSAGNADTLDGEHASSFVRAGTIEVGSPDLNALDTYSFIKSVNSQVAGHSPKGNIGWYNVIQLVHRNGAGDGPSYIGQIALGMTTNVNDIFFRTRRTDPWKTIIHSNNYTEFIDNYYWANVKISTSANTQTTPSVNTIFANNWFRSQGDTGWYNESYGGGIRMTDTKWIRTFGGKSFYCDSQISSYGFHHLNHDNNDAVLLAGGSYMIHKTGSTSYSTAIQFGNYVWLTLSIDKATSNCQVVPYNISNPTKNVYVTSIQIGNYSNSRNGTYRVAPNGKLYHVEGTEEGAIHATICYIAS